MNKSDFIPRKGFTSPDNALYHYRDGSQVDVSSGYHPHSSTRFCNWEADVPARIANRVLPELYSDRSECCGCAACAAACPCSAISMEPDEEGFLYPVVDISFCIRCYRCEEACVFKLAIRDRWCPNKTTGDTEKQNA